MTPLELNERIADIPNECFEAYPAGYYSYEEHMKMTKQLLYDVIQAVTPEKAVWPEDMEYVEMVRDASAHGQYDDMFMNGQIEVTKAIKENTKNLMGEKR